MANAGIIKHAPIDNIRIREFPPPLPFPLPLSFPRSRVVLLVAAIPLARGQVRVAIVNAFAVRCRTNTVIIMVPYRIVTPNTHSHQTIPIESTQCSAATCVRSM